MWDGTRHPHPTQERGAEIELRLQPHHTLHLSLRLQISPDPAFFPTPLPRQHLLRQLLAAHLHIATVVNHQSSSIMGRTNKQSSSSSFWYARRRASSAPATPRPEPAEDSPPPVGCMSMVHYLIFAPGAGCVGRPPTGSSNVAIVTPHDSIIHSPRPRDGDKKSSGFDAPRNSLDLDTDNPNDIQIEPVFDALARTSMRRHKPTAPSTPSLVARLMGIDGLPDQPSPSPAARHKKPSSTKKHHHIDDDKENHHCSNKEKKKRVIPESMNRREPLRSLSCNVGTTGELARSSSLPETPRASTSARASWDGARLSLQALKENVLDRAAQYMSMPSSPTSAGGKNRSFTSRRRRDEKEREKVAKEHAREILRQAKENVASRKKASSKQQTSSNKSSSPAADKENVAPAASPAASVEDKLVVVVQPAKSQGTENPVSSQKSLRVPLAPRQQQQQQHPPPQRAKPSRPPPPPPPLDPPPPPTRARRPDGCERFATRVKKPAVAGGQGQPLAPASSSSPAMAAPPPAPASSSPSVQIGNKQSPISPATVPLEENPEYSYVRAVLERGGYMRRSPPAAPPPRCPCHSVSSPVDPIVFHLLELDLPADEASAEAVRLGPLRHRWNRKLLFHLTQELLTDLAESDTPAAMAAAPAMTGVPLLRSIWKKVRSFPAADCKVVGDIDALVAADFESRRRRMVSHPAAVVEEAAAVAEEVTARVMEALIGECVAESFSLSTVPGGLTRSSSSSSSSRAQAR
ncbi:hypothetical protein HU200_065272 [Digitaria exilis]|uniref:DUF4378 domain-containing protein n=1 Tax=Digitaria exilis TaxID=1010633 RepID=A0A834ZYT1_9POAL|nr:hypothetical protein HU200_065272 [Digitaria exilis]